MSHYLDLSTQLLQTASLAVFLVAALVLTRRWLESRPGKSRRGAGNRLVIGVLFGALGVLTFQIPIVIADVKIGLGPSFVICSILFGGIPSGARNGDDPLGKQGSANRVARSLRRP
ncbi:MAG: hypothetical protein WDO24_01505 [Pseudomonadota bacterium]